MTNQNQANKPRISRREFARGGALAAASAALLPEIVAGQTPAEQPALTTASQAEVDGKVGAVMRRYGNLLSDAEKLDVRRLITEAQKPLEQMRDFALHLENGDQPGNVLRLYPDAPPLTLKPSPKTSARGGKS